MKKNPLRKWLKYLRPATVCRGLWSTIGGLKELMPRLFGLTPPVPTFQAPPKRGRLWPRPKKPSFQPTIDVLEDRQMLTAVQFTQATFSVGEAVGTATITAELDAAASETVTVDYSTTSGTASAADFTDTSGTLTFTPGQTSQTFTVTINNDSLDEEDEDFTVALSNPSSNVDLGAQSTSTVTIQDNDVAPEVFFSAANYGVDESGPGSTTTITVTLSAASGKTVTVDFATSDGTAVVSAYDYYATWGTLTFNPGETSQTFTVTAFDDSLDEDPETINLTLSAPDNATLGSQATATVTITDDDATPTVGFSLSEYSVD